MHITIWFFVSRIFFLVTVTSSQGTDPCNTKDELPHLNERIVGYKLNANETAICDYYLDEQWYSLIGKYIIADSAKTCGTTYNWYLKDKLPKHGQTNIDVCRNAGVGHTCSETKTIEVKKCSKGYVFNLKPLDGCSEAYCIQLIDSNAKGGSAPPDISNINPDVNVEVVENKKVNLEFYCDIKPDPKTNLQYIVEWSLNTGTSLTRSLYKTTSNLHQSQEDFRRKTALTEHHLKTNNINTPGFTLVCTVKARKGSDGQYSSSRASAAKFFGVEVVNMSSVRLKDGEKKTIFLKLTIPFGCTSGNCYIDFNTFIPKKSDSCLISRLAHSAHEAVYCGVRFHKEDFERGTLKPFVVTATFGKTQVQQTSLMYDVVFTTGARHEHSFFANYRAASVQIELDVNQTILKDRECYSRSDPHMLTFDGTAYDNQRDGTFIMYRHKELEVEVQTKTARCSKWDHGSWRPWCNCAVAVRAGKDIFMLDRCNTGLNRPTRFICEDGVLDRKVKIDGNKYKIFLPTGGIVDLDDDEQFINVHISPSLVDFNKTEGLCGLFDNDKSNDRTIRPNSSKKDSSISWKVNETAGENLFDTHNHGRLKHWKEDRYLCHCERDYSRLYTDPVNPGVICDPVKRILCPDDRTMQHVRQICDKKIGGRRKRDYESRLTDSYSDADTNYVPNKAYKQDETSIPELRRYSKRRRSVYDNNTAHTDCLDMMNTTAFKMCKQIPDLNFETLIENCVADAVITNSMDWTMTHLEGIKSKCINHVDVLQPLPPDVLAELEEPGNDGTNTTNITNLFNDTVELLTSPGPVYPGMFSITMELLDSIKAVSCSNECSGHGTCVNGTCKCNEPFTSFDCSINGTKPPVMFGIPDKGKCDLRTRLCAETSVLGRHFAKTKALSCRLIPFYMNKNKNITESDRIESPGSFESLNEVYCPLGHVRQKRSTGGETSDDFISRGFRVSVSNDGIGFSDEDTIIVFDSNCVDCSKLNGKILCSTKSGYCMKGGKCFSPGEMSGCHVCNEELSGHFSWEAGPDCPKPVKSKETGKLWIIGAVLGPFACVMLTAVAVMCYIGKRGKSSKRKVGSMVEIK